MCLSEAYKSPSCAPASSRIFSTASLMRCRPIERAETRASPQIYSQYAAIRRHEIKMCEGVRREFSIPRIELEFLRIDSFSFSLQYAHSLGDKIFRRLVTDRRRHQKRGAREKYQYFIQILGNCGFPDQIHNAAVSAPYTEYTNGKKLFFIECNA